MAFTLIAHGHQACTSDLGTSVVSPSLDTTNADLFLVWTTYDSGGSAPTISDSKGNSGWTYETAVASGSTSRGRLAYCVPTSVGTGHTFTASGTLVPCIYVSAFSGASASSPRDQYASASSLSPGSITPTEDNELIFCGVMGFTTTPTAIDESMTILDTQAFVSLRTYTGGVAYKIQTTAAAISPTWTASGSSNPCSFIASFKVAGASSAIKTINGLARASVKTINGLALASVKTYNGLA